MNVSYTCKGLTCPNCAGKIETDVRKMAGIVAARIDLFRQKLHIESQDGLESANLLQKIREIVAKYEPDVEVLLDDANVVEGSELRFVLDGLDVSDAEAVREVVAGLPGVIRASLSGKNSLSVSSSLSSNGLLSQIAAIVSRTRPGATVRPHEGGAREKHGFLFYLTCLGAALFIPALVLWYSGIGNGPAEQLFFIALYILFGYPVIAPAFSSIRKLSFFDENTLMSVATMGALALGEYPEACAVMLFYRIGEYFQDRALRSSRKSISHLMELRSDIATVVTDEGPKVLPAQAVKAGDRILVRPGERIPVDGCVEVGESALDLRALTGETVPKAVSPGDTVLSGAVNGTGVLTVRAMCGYQDSTVAKMLALIESAQMRKSKAERFITRFARWYTPLVVGSALLLALFPPLLGMGSWETWIHRSLIFLIVSCPCALVLSIPLTFFAGIGAASRQGILVKGGSVFESLGRLDTLVLDKTGTVTEGTFSLSRLLPVQGSNEADLLACARDALSESLHPIARAICEGVKAQGKLLECTEFPGMGVRSKVLREGAEHILLAGNPALFRREGIECRYEGGCGVLVARDGVFIGQILVTDTLRSRIGESLRALRQDGVRRIVLLSGDSGDAVARVAGALPVDAAYGELLPQDKVAHVESLLAELPPGAKLAFVGDGINDAPVLARSDIGIAMGGIGSDAALEAADIVLMTDDPGKIRLALMIARRTNGIAFANIVLALGIKGFVLLLGALGLAGMWAAVFADVGVTLLCVANAFRLHGQFSLDSVGREE